MSERPIAFVTGGSGGLGKSGNARQLAALAGRQRLHTVLVDGNPGQQSQRAWHRLDADRMLENAQWDDLKHAMVMPRELGQPYALLPGPLDPRTPGLIGLYGRALIALSRDPHIDLIVVDADRMDPAQWRSSHTFAGGVIRPFMQAGAGRILFRIGQTGSQLGDGLKTLDAVGMPELTITCAQAPGTLANPRPDKDWKRMLDGLSRFAGTDQWTAQSLTGQQPGQPQGTQCPAWLARQARFVGVDVSADTDGKGVSWLRRILA